MASFKPVKRKILPRLKGEPTPDNKYWSSYNYPVTIKDYAPIQSISFSRSKPHYFAVTTSAKVQVLSPTSLETHKTFSRFKEAAYGARFRSDGKLLVVGGHEGIVRVLDVGTKSILREFKNNKAPVHTTRFTADNTHVLSFGDDRSVRYFDIPAQTQLRSFKDHGDYVRSGDACVHNQDIFVSGCYDHKARVFDLRTNKVVQEVHHGAPVEAVLVFPSGNVFLTAGGTSVKVWDIIGGGSLLGTLSHHHKTITDLCFASGNQRFLSSSIDRHVKVYDSGSYSLIHSMDFPAPVMSIGVSMDDELLCVGMTDGTLSMQKRKEAVDDELLEQKRLVKRHFNKYLLKEKVYQPEEGDVVIKEQQRPHLQRYDKFLKTFQFTKALDRVLIYYVWGQSPDVTISVIQEIDRRGGLVAAVAGRCPQELVHLITFLCKYITDPRFSTVTLGLAELLWKTYPSLYGQAKETDILIDKLQEILTTETEAQKGLKMVLGTLDVLLSTGELNSTAIEDDETSLDAVIKPGNVSTVT